ncbi:hypothetical protein DY000_02041012 [Brassica cretica]|uniref:Uncharacterized protein n=1 Tax=Brassica cretica TaxID=69181 RepID=A0ABQ7BN01_BRACR|nr:hypothetical protein DY000_02041012 [Brassica cretica]
MPSSLYRRPSSLSRLRITVRRRLCLRSVFDPSSSAPPHRPRLDLSSSAPLHRPLSVVVYVSHYLVSPI